MGGTMVTVRLKDETVYSYVLISNSQFIIAVRDYQDLPFKIDDIIDIFQTEEDKGMTREKVKQLPSSWHYWDDWKKQC